MNPDALQAMLDCQHMPEFPPAGQPVTREAHLMCWSIAPSSGFDQLQLCGMCGAHRTSRRDQTTWGEWILPEFLRRLKAATPMRGAYRVRAMDAYGREAVLSVREGVLPGVVAFDVISAQGGDAHLSVRAPEALMLAEAVRQAAQGCKR